ncbi:MAG: hypothetical protein FJ308_07970 [Planctomycetes bacterium]|nr:hypothetical protein [Planctomycetota bacterium]
MDDGVHPFWLLGESSWGQLLYNAGQNLHLLSDVKVTSIYSPLSNIYLLSAQRIAAFAAVIVLNAVTQSRT